MSERSEIIGQWYFNDLIGHKGPIPNPDIARFFMKNLMNIAGADGCLTERERQWIIGYAASCGNPKEVIDELKTFEPGQDTDVFNLLIKDKDKPYVKQTRYSMIYNAIRAAGADGELHEKEIAAIYKFAKQLEISPEQVQQIQDLYEEEQKMREKRLEILFPQGLDTVLDAFDKHK